MRVLLSSTRGAGHIHPLLPYARALLARGHEVLVAGPADLGDTLGAAGLEHAVFDHPGDARLGPLWSGLRAAPADQRDAYIVREIFAGLNATTALPKLRETIRTWQPKLVLRESVEFAAVVAAAAAGIPCACVAVHSATAEAPMVALPPSRRSMRCARAPGCRRTLGFRCARSPPSPGSHRRWTDRTVRRSERLPFMSAPGSKDCRARRPRLGARE